MTTYNDLINRGGTIYNKTTNQGYTDPTSLARDLGITADKINWSAIQNEATPTTTTNTNNPLSGLGQGISNPFQVNIPQTITTPQVASAITASPLPSNVQQGIQQASATTNYGNLVNKGGTIYNTQTGQGYQDPAQLASALGIRPDQIQWGQIATEEKVQEAKDVIQDVATSPSSRYAGMLDASGITGAKSNLTNLFTQIQGIINQPDIQLDDSQVKAKQQALDKFNEDYTKQMEAWAKEEARIMGNWGVGPIWRGRLALFQDQKAIQLMPLEARQAILEGSLENAQAMAQQMFENSVSQQQSKVSNMSNLFNMMSGLISDEEANIYKQFQLDENERLRKLEAEQNMTQQKTELFLKYPFFNMTDTMDEIMKKIGPKAQQEFNSNLIKSQSTGTLAPNSLDDLAKLGYTRRMSQSGIGWDFFKGGKPVTAEDISKATGVSLAILLSGSNNPGDYAKISPVPAVKNLSAEQQSIINDAKSALDQAKQMYQDTAAVRNAIIQQALQGYGFDLSPYI